MKIVGDPLNKLVYKKLKNIDKDYRKGITLAYKDLAVKLKETTKKDFIAPKSGRVYVKRLKGRLVRHRASAPGEPPAKFTGTLEKSLETKNSGWSQLDYSAGNNDAYYASFLEFGTSRMAKRPYMIKSVNDNERNAELYFEIRIGNELKTFN